tara:strand:+ start:4389 stop:4667 length:279 start_codon:yes stop_codon:yes gene_type:complete
MNTKNTHSTTAPLTEPCLRAELEAIEAATIKQAEALAEAEAELENAKEKAEKRDKALNRLWELRQKTVMAKTTRLHIEERLKSTALFDLLNN